MKCLDFIGFTPQLFVDSSQRFQTRLGGFLTILVVLLSLLSLSAFGKDMIFKENPTLYQYDQFNVNNEIDFKEIPFLIGLMKLGGFSISEISRKLQVTLQYAITNSSNTDNPTEFIFYDLVPCLQCNLFKNNMMNIKKNLIGDPANFYCLPDNLTLSWFGQFGNPNFRIGRLYVRQCQNSTSNNSCLPIEEIQKDLTEFYAQYIFLDRYYDLTNYEQPVTAYWRSDLLQLGGYSSRSDQYTTRVLSLKSDEGLILETNNQITTSQFNSKIALAMGFNPQFFLLLVTDISNISTVLGRKYAKVQAIMANTGGFVKFVLLIIATFNNFISRYLFIEKIYLKSFIKYNQFYSGFNNSKKGANPLTSPKEKNKKFTIPIVTNNYVNNNKNNVVSNSILISSNNNEKNIYKKNKVYEKKKLNYQNLKCFSFLCYKKKRFDTLDQLDKIFISQMDVIKIFYLSKKFILTENLIFGNLGQKWKDLLVHIDITEIIRSSKKKPYSNEINDMWKSLDILKNTPKTIDAHQILCEEIFKSDILKRV
jgi:hypothetical protein